MGGTVSQLDVVTLDSQRNSRAGATRKTKRTPTENWFQAADGSRLFYRYWPAESGAGDRAIVLLHRGHEHSGRLQGVVDKLDLGDFHMFAWDARGHGRSPGERGYARSFAELEKDLDGFVKHICQSCLIAQDRIAVVAQSISSVLVCAWVHDFAPKIRCMVLASPAFKVKLYVPLAKLGLRLLLALKGKAFIKSYVKAKFLTHDPAQIAAYENDPLISRSIAVNILLDLEDTADRLIADAAAIHAPTQVLISGADWVVRQKPQQVFCERLGSAVKEQHRFAEFYHDTLNEKDNHLPLAKAREFIQNQFAKPGFRPSLVGADEHGHTKLEYDALIKPLAPLSPKGVYFAATRMALRTVGRLSAGMRIGLDSGFDSGAALDYVYQNCPQGITPIGKLLDWAYLNSIGWRGIRQRKEHLARLIRAVAQTLQQCGRPLRFLDIAAGHGRYLLEVLLELKKNKVPFDALLRDYSQPNVERGNTLIREMGLEREVCFETGDAFDADSLARITPRPTLVIVSGLYELIPENAPLQASLAGIVASIEADGYLIYTNQPWHPQLELIARTLTSHRDGAPWIMRRRSQMEIDQLVEAAGFTKTEQLIDHWGMFSVSVARKGKP